MGSCKRMSVVVARVFPTVTAEKVEKDIQNYRRLNKLKGFVDWEGNLAFFKRVLGISFKKRHNKPARG